MKNLLKTPLAINKRASTQDIVLPIESIDIDEYGVPYITGTRMKVKYIAHDALQGASIKDIKNSYPHLSTTHIRAALEYYSEHKETLDKQLSEDDQFIQEMREKAANKFSLDELLRRRKNLKAS